MITVTRDVILSIAGLHLEALEGETDQSPIEVITPASYFYRNGKHYILYEEVVEGSAEITKNKIKITGDYLLEIKKSGVVNAHMVFERDKKNLTCYETPYGQLVLGVDTTFLQVIETEDNIDIKVKYRLDVNHEPLADCLIRMNIKSKKSGTFVMKEALKL